MKHLNGRQQLQDVFMHKCILCIHFFLTTLIRKQFRRNTEFSVPWDIFPTPLLPHHLTKPLHQRIKNCTPRTSAQYYDPTCYFGETQISYKYFFRDVTPSPPVWPALRAAAGFRAFLAASQSGGGGGGGCKFQRIEIKTKKQNIGENILQL
jgi:hypothetical protein